MSKGNRIIEAQIATSIRERMFKRVCELASLFEARWMMGALAFHASDLHEALEDQIGRFNHALLKGTDAEIVEQGEATCRGWQAAIVAMEESGIADDAYHIGEFGGVIVAIGRQRHAPEHLRKQYGPDLVWLTPRECAALYTKLEVARALKAEWPDGELVDIRGKA
jgi:hypothetical protein